MSEEIIHICDLCKKNVTEKKAVKVEDNIYCSIECKRADGWVLYQGNILGFGYYIEKKTIEEFETWLEYGLNRSVFNMYEEDGVTKKNTESSELKIIKKLLGIKL